MPDQNQGQHDSKKYPALACMSTENLKRLLVQELDIPDDAEVDVAFIESITEVIKEREAGTPEEIKVDTEAAWNEFQNRLSEKIENTGAETDLQPTKKRKPLPIKSPNLRSCRLLRSIAAVIVIFLAVCGTASAFGLNVFQAVAEWTADTFHFVAGSGQNSSQLDPYSELRAVVGDKTDVTVVPNWAPEGTALKESISVADCSNGVRIQSVYESISGSFSIRIHIYNYATDDFSGLYQKDAGSVQLYNSGGITHYFFHNNGKHGVAWTNGLLEVAIQGDLPVDDLKRMIDSIYEEE